ncbi:MAG: tRNA uridine(34) 5-carboxymethylaminomethyl modification radical SAM/GNAT enzyme Elp3 [Chloroflexota bacterium]
MPKSAVQRFDYKLDDSIVHNDASWKERNQQKVDLTQHQALFLGLIGELAALKKLTGKNYHATMRRYARQGMPWLSKSQLQVAYQDACDQGLLEFDPELKTKIQMKPVRSQAGVTVVTVLTKPYPCPGKCIFCPTDVRMPKSYLHDEPGAQRAERYSFDPYDQTAGRIAALEKIGHPTQKIELLILGGTWSSYPRNYQEWFIKRCFDGMNGTDSDALEDAQLLNETSNHRNVGLVVETRQDHISIDELRWMRYLGVTKVQVGIQSMDEHVLAINKRGHDTQATRDAFKLLRAGGFKIHGHWMPNLLGATPESDIADYDSLWNDPAVRPDELKIYPCMLVENAELYAYWQRGEYKPYSEEEVTDILVHCITQTPVYARLTRVIRDIPTNNVVEGFTKANLRQLAEEKAKKMGQRATDIRGREIRRETVSIENLQLLTQTYETMGTTEHFLSFETKEDNSKRRIAGFLRLSFPNADETAIVDELEDCAMIREVHVYGPALDLDKSGQGEAQHIGLGTKLVNKAIEMAKAAGYANIAVISAIGTRKYYKKHGFQNTGLYMTRPVAI